MTKNDSSHEMAAQAVLSVLAQAPASGLKVGDLATLLRVSKQDLYKLRKLLAQLVSAGSITRLTRGVYALSAKTSPDAEPAAGTARDTTRAPDRGAGRGAKRVARRDPGPAADRNAKARPAAPRPAAPPVSPIPAQVDDIDPSITGRISVHPAGYGFVELEDDSGDVFVPAKYRGAALDGDRVELATWDGYKGTEGRVVRVLSRGRAKLTGTLVQVGRAVCLQPDDPRIATDYGQVPLIEGVVRAKVGQAAVIEISRYPTEERPELYGRLVRILGEPDDPRTEIEKILICADIPQIFAPAALSQAEHTAQELGPADFADRVDLRDRPFVTIDPEDARDFDDALCIENGPGGTTRVWVAVADVSHYVRTDDPLDQEAVIRGVSVYLPDRVVPMLPFPLSSGICSLKPEVDRCAMVVRLDFAADGTLAGTGFTAAVIRSHARLDYPGVAAALSGDFRGRRMGYRRWSDSLSRMHALAQVLRARRMSRGSLMLDIAEARVLLDEDDPLLVRDIVRSKSSEHVKLAYQLVEEFMIAANEAVGEFFRQRDLPTVWRVHAPPEHERIEALAEVLARFGIDLDVERVATPQGMKEIIAAVDQVPAAQPLSFLILRSLKQAFYDVNPIGHFGLASTHYLHFTSPIRRYPDLLVHRLLKAQLHAEGQASGGGGKIPVPDVERLRDLAHAVSQHERRALEAEREAVAMYRAYLMRGQVGEEFAGKISAVTHFGAFVEIDAPFVEGLIKLDDLGDDVFDHDEAAMCLSGRYSGACISLGESVLVQITNVSVPLRRIDLKLINIADTPAPWGPPPKRSRRRRS